MCNLYSITTNQAAIIALFRVDEPIRRQFAAAAEKWFVENDPEGVAFDEVLE